MAEAREGVGIAEAAIRLGISKDAVRRRIQRGTLTAFKDSGDRWLVVLPDEEAADGDHAARRDTTDSTPHDDDARSLLGTLTEQLKVKDEQIAEKDRQLAAREREVQELHVMLQTAQRLIPANISEPVESSVRPAEPPRPNEARRGTNTPQRAVPQAREASQRSRPAWWRRFFMGEE